MRLFLAVKVETSQQYIDTVNELKHLLRHDKIAWSDPYLSHLTLKFFGETPEKRTKQIINQVHKAVKELNEFDFSISKIGAFGSSYKPQVLWFGISEEEVLKSIHKKIMNYLNPIGYTPDAGNFVPHITIARINKTTDKQWFWKCIEKYQTQLIQKVEIKELILFESRLTSEKATHHIVEKFQLSSKNLIPPLP